MSLAAVFDALAKDQASLAALWKQIPAGICVYDTEARTLSSNELFTRIVGGAAADGQPPAPLVPLLARARSGETLIAAEIELASVGAPVRAHVSLIPIRNGATVTGVVAIVVDTSAEAGQRETMGIVGHDLRNPLAAIRMTAQLLGKTDEMTTERRLTLSNRILTSSSRMDAILRGLLDYAKTRAGVLVRLERESVDLGAMARRVGDEQAAYVNGRSVELRASGDLVGRWDAGRLEQILGQLIGNALRHGTGTTAQVAIDGTAPGEVRVTVTSEGPAIPPEVLGRIFDPFQIGPRPPNTPRRSIGLGLFVAKVLTQAHSGQVSVESTDAGTAFRLSLPRDAVTPA
jgi:signal transduction histidine kinase